MTPSRSRNAAGLRGAGWATAGMTRSAPLRRAEQLALDKLADRVCRGDVNLLDQRGLLGRHRQREIAERVHRSLPIPGEADGDEADLARGLQRRDDAWRAARCRDCHEHIALAAERAHLALEHM